MVDRGHSVHLLTFEPHLDSNHRQAFAGAMTRRGITWHSSRYHKRPSLPATLFDVLVGSAVAIWLIKRFDLDAVHARNHVPAAMALIATALTRRQMIFDLRGLMADEYVDAGRWRRGGIPYRITEWVQSAALRRAAAVVTLTKAVLPYIAQDRLGALRVSVIPCCADIERIQRSAHDGAAIRRQLGLSDRPVMIYIGKFTGWYMDDELVTFFTEAQGILPGLFLLMVTQADPEPVLRTLRRQRVKSNDYRFIQVAPEEIGRYLAAADFGVSLVRPSFSKISSSPTKIGEYLAAGLPVVSSHGIGDVDELLERAGVGVVLRSYDRAAYSQAARAIAELSRQPDIHTRCTSRARDRLSLRELGVPRYDELYRHIAAAR